MMRVIPPYLAGGALVAALGAAGLAWQFSAEVDQLQAKVASLTVMLNGCNGRVADIFADKERDNAVDEIPDSDLAGAVPGKWILPAQ